MNTITLSDKAWLEPLLLSIDATLSEYTFGNLFLFQPTHKYEWFELKGKRYVKGLSYTSEWFLIPLFTIEDPEELKEALVHSKASYFYPIDDRTKNHFDEKDWRTEVLHSESDYLYATDTIRTYKGRALDGRRNLIHQLEAEHQAISKPLNIEASHTVLNNWYQEFKKAENEVTACKLALQHWSELSLFGQTIYIDGKPEGFTIGEKLNANTAVLHFAKAVGPEKGLYQYLYQDFACSIPHEYLYLNWEQDLGIEGIRQAKEAYRPIAHLNKWRIIPKN